MKPSKTKTGLPIIETVGQYGFEYGVTFRVVQRDSESRILRSIGGLSEAEAESLATEWAEAWAERRG